MRIILPNSSVIGYDRLVTTIYRTDCVPVPITLEFQVILNEELKQFLKEKSIIHVGDDYAELQIIKAVEMPTSIIKGDSRVEIGSYIAVINGGEKLIQPVKSAISLQNTSIGAALRASGSRLKVNEDVPLIKYFCPFGQTPSFEIARKCGEEAAVICPEGAKISVRRLSNLMQSEPKLRLDASAVQFINNPTSVIHHVPSYITVNQDGSTIEGEIKQGNIADFYPNLDARRLKNLSTALITKGTLMRMLSPAINAGDSVLVNDERYFILTAAHRFDTGVLGDPTVSASKFWLAQVEKI